MGSSPEPRGILPATPANIRLAARRILEGELVGVPTETVYGVAARADSPAAMARLYAAKGREESKRIAFFAADVASVWRAGVPVDAVAEKLAAAFWPGPLTLVLRNATGGWDGFRVPDHPVALAWIRELPGLPAVTSANLSGQPAARTASQAWEALGDQMAMVLDAGPSGEGPASTVVKVFDGRLEMLREGPISQAEVVRAAGVSARLQ